MTHLFRFRHKRLRLGAIALSTLVLLLGLWGRPAAATPARHYTELEFGPPPEVTLPNYTRYVMDNGIVVYLVEDHELPLISGSAFFRTGNRLEPSDKTGLGNIVGTVMRSGGTIHHPADELNQRLEQRAASVETSIDLTLGSAGFDALSEDVQEVFGLFGDVIRNPAFPQDKIELVKNQWRGSIARRNDSPDDIVEREFQKLIYGDDSPYARTIEYTTLDHISRDDILQFYRSYIHPQTMMLGIVGDFDPDQMRSLIDQTFGDWRSPADAIIPEESSLPPVQQARMGGVFLVDQPQLTQSYIQLGHLGGELDSPGYAALSVLNDVLNGLGGRLVNEVRSRQGLAYVVYAYWSPRFDYPGLFISGGQTRTETTVAFIESTLAEIATVRTQPIEEDELARAKDASLNSFIFSFQTPEQTLSRLMRYEYYGYPSDFIFQYQEAVAEVTVNDVLEAAQTYLQPDSIVTLVVGNAAAIDPPLSTLSNGNAITPIDITIPAPPGNGA